MKIVHATWEKRNLGVDSYKFEIEENDSFEVFAEKEAEISCDYKVVKVSNHNSQFYSRLSNCGYDFIEAQVFCCRRTDREFCMSPIQQRLYSKMNYSIATETETEHLCQRIIDEKLFDNDTIAMDPNFSIELANQRFVGQIKDELSRGSTLYNIFYKDKIIGFFGLTQLNGDSIYTFLGGIFKDYQNCGFGVLMNYLALTAAREKGAKRLHSAFSSNNNGAFDLHVSADYSVDEILYIFVKHE